jgi:4'-phosphopantetheinyl transferase EntD
MNAPFMPTITVPETFSATIKAASRQPCSSPVLLDLSALEDHGSTEERLCTTWLSTGERDHFSHFKLKKRKKEWLAGRICAKIAVQEYFSIHCHDRMMPACTEFSIANSATGRPLLIWNTGEPSEQGPDISISHSGSLALAIAAQTCCGVDIQKTRDALVRVRERFCTGREEQLLLSAVHKDQPLIPLTLLWAAKEAAKKALSITEMPGFLDLVLARITRIDDEWLFIFNQHQARLPLEIRVITTCYRDYGLGVCVP